MSLDGPQEWPGCLGLTRVSELELLVICMYNDTVDFYSAVSHSGRVHGHTTLYEVTEWLSSELVERRDSRSKDPRFEPHQRQEHKENLSECFQVKNVVLTRWHCWCAPPPCVYIWHKNEHARKL